MLPRQWGRIRKVTAAYNNFGVGDKSLDIVTLNVYHPFIPPMGVDGELVRTLKKGGLFVSAHPIGWHIDVTEEFLAPILINMK